jgi:hypothetical protein
VECVTMSRLIHSNGRDLATALVTAIMVLASGKIGARKFSKRLCAAGAVLACHLDAAKTILGDFCVNIGAHVNVCLLAFLCVCAPLGVVIG